MSAAAEITGYVEATTATQVLGWAWAPRTPQQRVRVQALLGDAVVAEAPADREREDLARNGIGDGRHAFELKLPEAARDRLAELRVVVRTEDGAAVPLGLPTPLDGTAERLERLQRTADALVASQRVLHRNLQSALVAPRPAAEAVDVSGVIEPLSKQIATLELFVMRLDERLAALSGAGPAAPGGRRVSGGTLAAFAVATLALAVSAWGLWRQLP